jgi:high-affinity K+ transport system ATPase subunit B
MSLSATDIAGLVTPFLGIKLIDLIVHDLLGA